MPFDNTLSLRLAAKFPIRQNAWCLSTYQPFLKFFKQRIAVENIQPGDAKIGVVLVFTWMQATEPKLNCWNHFPRAKTLLLRDRVGRLNAAEIDELKPFVGGSLLATSTFLHFLNPSRYAIWSTNVARAAYRYSWQQCNRSDRYIEYLDDIKRLQLHDALRGRVRDAIGSVGKLRSKEFAISQLGISESMPAGSSPRGDLADFSFATEKFVLDISADD